ncbi:MAG: phosphoglycerol geranylgeranyltransferase [Candidatus Latescibacterota bacterium]
MPFGKATSVYEYLLEAKRTRGAGFLVLLDPDRANPAGIRVQAGRCRDAGVDAILVGSSLMMGRGFEDAVRSVKEAVDIPVIIFPGEKSQVCEEADAILFLSLLSGRNPEYLIGQQVQSAPLVRSIGLEALSTAYLLVDSGRTTSVEFMSNTRPLPADKPEIALAHAMAAEILGMKFVYLEAGSGAERPAPDSMIRAVSAGVRIPVIVGGGIRNPDAAAQKVEAGASFVVVGNHLEGEGKDRDLEAFVRAVHRHVY